MDLRIKFLIVAVLQFIAFSSVLSFDRMALPLFSPIFLLSLIVPLCFYCTISAPVKRQIIAISLAAFASIAIGVYQSLVLIFNRFDGSLAIVAIALSLVVIFASPLAAFSETKSRYERWVLSLISTYETLISGAIAIAAVWALVGVMQALLSTIGLELPRKLFRTPFFSVAIFVFSFALGAFFAQREHINFGKRLAEIIYLFLAAIALFFTLIWAIAGFGKINFASAYILIGFVWALILFFNLKTRCGLENSSHKIIRILIAASWVAALPMIFTAIYGLAVRIAQYSLTPMRIWGLMIAVFAAILSVGYAISSLPKLPRTRVIAAANVSSVLAAIVCVFLMISGVVDPNRISVIYQIARLDIDRDFNGVLKFLRKNNTIFAEEALAKIKAGDQVNPRLNSDDQKVLQLNANEAAKGAYRVEKFRSLLQETNTTNGEKLPPDLIDALVKEWQNSYEGKHKSTDKPLNAITILKIKFENQKTDSWILFNKDLSTFNLVIWQLLDGTYRHVGNIQTNCTRYILDLTSYIQNNPDISYKRSEIIKIGNLELRANFDRDRIDCDKLK